MPILTLRDGDARQGSLVCVHPITGNAEVYAGLAHALAWPGPVLGFTAPEEAGYTLAELARRYRDELDLAAPQRLLGWALGGVVAAELARAIVEAGGSVRFLGLLDSRAPQPEMRRRPMEREAFAKAFIHNAAMTREKTPPALAGTDAAHLAAALRELGDDASDAQAERRFSIFMALGRAFYQHEQQPVSVPVHLFEAIDAHPSHPKPPTLGWEPLAPEVVHHPIAGTHFTLLAPAHVPALAQAIDRALGG